MWKFAKLKKAPDGTVIPDNVLVPCPLSGVQVKRLASKCCPDCKYFEGLAMLAWADTDEDNAKIKKLPWPKRYAIRCVTIAEWTTEEIFE